jgi:hypothetical protein
VICRSARRRSRPAGGAVVKAPYDDAHERRAVVYDNQGDGLVLYKPLAR